MLAYIIRRVAQSILVLFVVAIPSLTESGNVKVNLGTDTFSPGSAEARAESIAEEGPLLFSDVASGQRDIYLQHLGDDPEEGWLAFDARRPGQSRDCSLEWVAEEDHFVDPCDDTVVAADGGDLLHYDVVVTEDGDVVIDFRSDEGTDDTTP